MDINDLPNLENCLTIGHLKELIYQIPKEYSSCLVMIERVKDIEFELYNRQSLKLDFDMGSYIDTCEFITAIGVYHDKENNILRIQMNY